MDVYAIIKTGGKQYRVVPGDVVKVEKLALAPGATVQIHDVYMLVNDDGVTTGNPAIPNARVVAEVVEEGRDQKIVVFKMKRRKGYRRTRGHRQHYTMLRISEISLGDAVYRPKANRSASSIRAAAGTAPTSTPPLAGEHAPIASIEPAKSAAVPQAPLPANAPPASESIPAPAVVTTPNDKAGSAPPRIMPGESRAGAQEPVAAAPGITLPPPPAPATAPEQRPKPPAPAVVRPPIRTTSAATIPPPLPKTDALEAPARRDRRYWLAAGLAVLLLAVIGSFFIGSREPTPGETVPVAAPAPEQVAPPRQIVPPRASKPKPDVRDVAIKEPAAVSAPSAPAQPPD